MTIMENGSALTGRKKMTQKVEFIESYIKFVNGSADYQWHDNHGELIRCKDCKWRSLYCTEATDRSTLYTCNHPCANDVPRPADWFCADGERRTDDDN